jgi:competence ComEA-like helix-hairpin-helix protein
MEQRTLLIAGIVAAAALAAGWRNLAPKAPPIYSAASSAGAGSAGAEAGPPASLGSSETGPTTSLENPEAGDPPGLGRPAGLQPRPAQGRVVVYVAGEVRRPGVYTLPASARAEAALAAAGGSTASADLVAVNLAEHLADGEAFVVPPKGAAELRSPGAAEPRSGISRRGGGVRIGRAAGHGGRAARASFGRARKALPASPIDVNSAGAAELERLPGIGPSLAERIVAFRELNGRFTRVDDLLDVAGMNDRKLEALAPYVSLRY